MTNQEFSAIWSPWKIGEILGKGSFGTVYKITKEEFGRTYVSALKHISIPMDEQQKKTLFSEGITTKENVSDFYKQIMMDLRKEIETTYALKGHTNIVSYEDHKIIPKKDGIGYDIFIKMEYLKSLSDVIVERGLTKNDIVKLGIDMCRALETLEKEKIIHRDIKPSNLFVNGKGDYKLGDFGVARELNKTVSGLSVKGTYKYMPPEIFMGENINFTADIYSLGLVMYILLNNNRAPFLSPTAEMISYDETERANYKRMHGEKLPKPHNADQNLASIILKACEYKPSDRWQSAKNFREALESYHKAYPVFNPAEEKTVYNPNPMGVKKVEVPDETVLLPIDVNMDVNIEKRSTKNNRNKIIIPLSIMSASLLLLTVILIVGGNFVDSEEDVLISEMEGKVFVEYEGTTKIVTPEEFESMSEDYNIETVSEEDNEIIEEENADNNKAENKTTQKKVNGNANTTKTEVIVKTTKKADKTTTKKIEKTTKKIVTTTKKTSYSDAEIVKICTDAINKAKRESPGYTKGKYQKLEGDRSAVPAFYNSLFGLFEEDSMKTFANGQANVSSFGAGGYIATKVTDPTYIKMEVKNGKYIINYNFGTETNPAELNSRYGRTMDVMTPTEVKSKSLGLISDVSMKYHDGFLKAEVDIATGNLTYLQIGAYVDLEVNKNKADVGFTIRNFVSRSTYTNFKW